MKKAALLTVALLLAALVVFLSVAREDWPDHDPSPEAVQIGKAAAEEYRELKLRAVTQQTHSAYGDYLNYGATVDHSKSSRVKMTDEGLPLVKYGDSYELNPVAISQFALAEHGRHVSDGEPADLFLRAARKLIEMQSDDGAFRYHFPKRHYTMAAPYKDGWVSGMAQGQGLSVLARAWKMTGEDAFLEAGNKALEFLATPIENGGPMTTLADIDPSLSGYIFFEEYLTEPDVYTLNGYIFTLLGLYDWWQLGESDEAGDYFERGVKSLAKLLPYYDLGNFSTYDLSYITSERPPFIEPIVAHVNTGYHRLHIQLLLALDAITDEPVFAETAERWRGYVAAPAVR